MAQTKETFTYTQMYVLGLATTVLSNIQFNGILKLRKKNLDSKEKWVTFLELPNLYFYLNSKFIYYLLLLI